jgi:6-phospho-beta-glucosidase
MIDSIKKGIGIPDVDVQYVGLNHLSWVTAINHDGKDLLPKALNEGLSAGKMTNIPSGGFEVDLLKTIGAIPSDYLQYFYHYDDKLKHQLEAEKCRGEICMEIEKSLLEKYKAEELKEKPEELNKRGGHRYSEAAISLVDALENDKDELHVVNVQNNGTLHFLDDNDVIEAMCYIGKNGAKPIKIDDFNNQHIISMIQSVKTYEKYTAEAAVTGNDETALKALLSHPLLMDYTNTKACYFELKEQHKKYLPQFK